MQHNERDEQCWRPSKPGQTVARGYYSHEQCRPHDTSVRRVSTREVSPARWEEVHTGGLRDQLAALLY
jgi:hypothetical protein